MRNYNSHILCGLALLALGTQVYARSTTHQVYPVEPSESFGRSSETAYYLTLGSFKHKSSGTRYYESVYPTSQARIRIIKKHGLYKVVAGPFHSSSDVMYASKQLLSKHHTHQQAINAIETVERPIVEEYPVNYPVAESKMGPVMTAEPKRISKVVSLSIGSAHSNNNHSQTFYLQPDLEKLILHRNKTVTLLH